MIELKNIPFFKKFSDKNIEAIKRHSSIAYYEPKEIIFYEKEKPKYLYVLLEGVAEIYKTNSKGKQLCILRVEAVDFLGEVAIFQNINYTTTIEAVTKCKVLKIDYYNLDKDFCKEEFFCKELVDSLYKRIIALMNVVDNSFLTSKERVARFILNSSSEFNGTTYTQISKKLNMTPETLSRILNDFKRKGIISMDKKHNLKIANIDELKKITE